MDSLSSVDLPKTAHLPPSYSCPLLRELDEVEIQNEMTLDSAQYEILLSHVEDVLDSAELTELSSYNLLYPWFSVVHSFYRLVLHLPLEYFSNPLGSIIYFTNYVYGIGAYVGIYLFLFAIQGTITILRLLGFGKIVRWISKNYAGGYSITSWADVGMFENKASTVQASRPVLSSKFKTYKPLKPVPHFIELNFYPQVAKSILLMSSIIYERDQLSVRRAFDHGRKNADSKPGNREKKICQVAKDLWDSEEKIRRAAKEWGCKFISIADFQRAEAPFAGAFYDLDSDPCPFIVIVFKGTSLEAMSDWITDTAMSLECCVDKLGAGFAHQGFYTSLFPSSSSTQQPSPYLKIIKAITIITKEWLESPRGKANAGVRMNLFVGGHSLGAGIASLFYARLLESPGDLSRHINLRDAYCFGTPRACDSTLASRFEYNLGKPKNFYRTLWRISNKASADKWGDIITHVPFGLADKRKARSSLKAASLLSYAAIGLPVILQSTGESPFFKFTSIPCGYKLNLKKLPEISKSSSLEHDNFEGYLNFIPRPSIINPVVLFNLVLKTVVPVLHDHFTGSYYKSLEKI